MSSGTSRQLGKLVSTGNALGATVSVASLKLTNPVKSIDLRITWGYTTDTTVMTLQALATAAGMLSIISSLEITGANGYSQVYSKEALLAMALQSKKTTVVDAISNTSTSTAYVDELILRIPVGLTTNYENLSITAVLSGTAVMYSAHPPTASAVTVEVGFNEGFVANEYRVYKRLITAITQTNISDLPTVGQLENIVLIQDLDAATGSSEYLASMNNVRVSQDTSLVTAPESYAQLLNFRERNMNLEQITSTLRGKIGMIPLQSLVLTNTEELEINQTATVDTFDLLMIVTRPNIAQNESPTTPYISNPSALVEESVAEPPLTNITDNGSGGQFVIGGGGFGLSLPTMSIGSGGKFQQLRPQA